MSAISAMGASDGWRVERRDGRRGVTQVEAPLRLTTRGRVVLVLLVATAVALMTLWGARAVASGPGEPVEVRVHVVEAGETLWQHASALASGGRDVRDVMADLAELNNLSSTGLQVGQQLLLPVDPEFGR
ncbi:LysM peptidoglycan-binding domain-containing protein [Oerskovia sp. KBS0722]|uniref:LysM peptidoglycan-binding domain-containing protein n=1 Tax=Oerskovia sp. KBS0722 TaxID=1179673 RepID=UPI00143DA566|nr:LysM peptidoglycan-binding domain-containing protein [Oerskovia sp. KBS0722]